MAFLAAEGLVALAVGSLLLLAYWPAVESGAMASPVALCGLVIVALSLIYMTGLALCAKIHAMLHPTSDLRGRLGAGENADLKALESEEQRKRKSQSDWGEAA